MRIVDVKLPRRALATLITTVSLTAVSSWLSADEPPAKATTANKDASAEDQLTPEARKVAQELKRSLAPDSEPRAMLDQILEGSRLGPGEGWFRLAVTQSRFGWKYAQAKYDTDQNGAISAEEFGGTQADSSRIDRSGDGVITTADFDWNEHSLARTPGTMLFFQADRDANGKLTQTEIAEFFKTLDSDDQGFLSLDDVRDEFQPPTEQMRVRRPDAPSPSTLVLALKRQEIGSLQHGPSLNERAPDFTLPTIKGENVTLSQEVGHQPIVLIFGNFTCGPFRSQSGNLQKLYDRYQHRAKFFLVYVREAHPSDGWSMTSNRHVGIDLAQPQNNGERRQVAQTCQSHLNLDIPFLVDGVDDKVGSTYSGMPNRLYLIDQQGTIVFKNGRGPFGFHPRELEQALVLLLNKTGSDDASN